MLNEFIQWLLDDGWMVWLLFFVAFSWTKPAPR
jgi:hypothetical protein